MSKEFYKKKRGNYMNVTYDLAAYNIVQDAYAKGRLIGDYIKGVDLVWNETLHEGIQTYVVYKDDNNKIFKIEKFTDLTAY